MKKSFFICIVFGLLLQGVSCSLNDDGPNFNFVPLQITNAEVPESFELNQTYQIMVSYALPDGCTSFSHPDVTIADTTTRNVVAWGTVRTDQVACPEEVTEGQATFNFIVKYDEPYIFRFWQGEGADGEQEYFEVIVPVN